jgi:hypothetical protein
MKKPLATASLFLFASLTPASLFAAENLSVKGCSGELLLMAELPESSASLNALLTSRAGDSLIGAELKLIRGTQTTTSFADASGRVVFSDIEAGEIQLCPAQQESFQVARAELSSTAGIGIGGVAAGVVGLGAVGVGIGNSGSSGSRENASPALSAGGSGSGSAAGSSSGSQASSSPSLVSDSSVPSRPRAPGRTPAKCNKVTQNALGDTEEGCRTNEEPTPVSPIA